MAKKAPPTETEDLSEKDRTHAEYFRRFPAQGEHHVEMGRGVERSRISRSTSNSPPRRGSISPPRQD